MDSSINSSDEISIDNNFKIDVLISRHQANSIVPKFSKGKIGSKAINVYCKEVYNIFSKLKLGEKMSFCKLGLLNFSSLCPGSNCFLLSLAFGLFVKELGFDFMLALDSFMSNHRFNYNVFIASKLHPIKTKLLNNMDIWKALDIVSHEKKIDIAVFGYTAQAPKIYKIFSSLNQVKKRQIPLYLFLKESEALSHIDYIFDLGLLNFGKKGKTCFFCGKHFSYSWFKIHKCIFERCFNCLRFFQQTKLSVSSSPTIFCSQNEMDKFDKYKNCISCSKVFKFRSCFDYHTKYVCKLYSFCKKCKSFFSTNYKFKHICGENFCRICFSMHDKDLKYCNFSRSSLTEVERKFPKHIFFADLHVSANNKKHALFLADVELSGFNELCGLVICQNKKYKFSDFKSDCAQYDMFDSDYTLKVALEHFSMEASVSGPILILCKLELYDNFKKILNRESRNLKNFKNYFEFGKICFKIFQNFVDFNDIQLAHLLGKNPNFAFIPDNVSFADTSVYYFKQGDFPTEELVFGDNIVLMDAIREGKKKFKANV